MNRRLLVLVVVVALAGCRSQQGSMADPFMGRTRVPPPGTGAAKMGPGTDPYYGNPTGAGVARPLMPASQTTAPAPVQPMPPAGYVPSPNSGYRSGPTGPYNGFQGSAVEQTQSLASEGSRVRVPPPTLSPQASQAVASTVMMEKALADKQPVAPVVWADKQPVASVGPQPMASVGPQPVASVESQPVAPAAREWSQPFPKTNVVSRSPADAASSAAADAGLSDTRIDRSVRPASYEGPRNLLAGGQRIVRTIPPRNAASPELQRLAIATSSGMAVAPRVPLLPLPAKATDIMDLPATRAKAAAGGSTGSETFSPYSRYGHGAKYDWLRGKVEYSEIDGRWKLRYIPIDGQTDDFGGSVVLADASLPEGVARGDFLEVRGKLGKQAAASQGYAPLYEVAQVKRLRN